MPKAITLRHVEGKPGKVYYPLELKEVPRPSPKEDELLIRLSAAALNHRDLFCRQALYPAISFSVPILADGVGYVQSPSTSPWTEKRVLINPGRGWVSSPLGPEGSYGILGGTTTCPLGTLQEYLCTAAADVEEAPAHLSDAEAAALPLTGLTAWRALVTKSGNAEPGRNILVTGIGGGVALMVLAFAVQMGAHVWVTSGNQEKIDKAVALGAKGGVLYSEEKWEKTLQAQLSESRPFIDAIIDGAGGDVAAKAAKLLKTGGVVVSYGMTLGPQLPFPMQAVMKNIEVRGSTMGSREEFKAMVKFVAEKQVRPVVSRTVVGLDNVEDIDGLFEDMKGGRQFGKLVVEFGGESQRSRL